MDALWRIIYTSQCARHWHVAEFGELEAFSVRRNAEREVTGLLLFDGAGFVQALEGPEAMVRLTLERIGQDRRHHHLIVAVDEGTVARQFGTWAMRCRQMPELAPSEDGSTALMHDLAGVTDGRTRAIFLDFARLSVQRARRLGARKAALTLEERAMQTHLDLLVQQAQEALDRNQAVRRLADDAARLDSATRRQFRLNS